MRSCRLGYQSGRTAASAARLFRTYVKKSHLPLVRRLLGGQQCLKRPGAFLQGLVIKDTLNKGRRAWDREVEAGVAIAGRRGVGQAGGLIVKLSALGSGCGVQPRVLN